MRSIMLITEFPNIEWLRAKAKSNFADQKGLNDQQLTQKGWPNVVLNTTSHGTERRDIKGTFSLFSNLSGKSTVSTNKRDLSIGTHTYAATNFGEYYDLVIPEGKEQTTTFNIHFGECLYKGVLQSLKGSHTESLDNPTTAKAANSVHFKTTLRDPAFDQQVENLRNYYGQNPSRSFNDQAEEVLLSQLLEFVLTKEHNDLKGKETIRSQKASTRNELLRRLWLSTDFIHENYDYPLSLETLSEVSMLSKFHYLRTFKEAFGITPQQYWRNVRMMRAQDLLLTSDLTIRQVALNVGFVEPNSFIRSFHDSFQVSPQKFRQKN